MEAVKEGKWILLDELNLARSEVLESLNRLLDANRELFVSELQLHLKAHQQFRIFATQNPSEYGGRKQLSTAFKNRFVLLQFSDISEEELLQIISERCKWVSQGQCREMCQIQRLLRMLRMKRNFFGGKDSVISVRDLIK